MERSPGRLARVGLLLLVLVVLVLAGNRRTVTGNYREAALIWFRGEDIYTGTGRGFLYLPQAAIGILGSYQITKGLTPPPQSVWLAPLVCTGFPAFLIRTRTAGNGGPHRLS